MANSRKYRSNITKLVTRVKRRLTGDKIILIGGSPRCGKTYVSRVLAESLSLPWISTDTIREQMRTIVRPEDFPTLFVHANSTPDTAIRFHLTHSPKDVVAFQNKESTEVWRGIEGLLKTDYSWRSYIVEGIAILPHLVHALRLKGKNVKVVFLIDDDLNRLRKTIFSDGLWADADKYSPDIKEKEIACILQFNKFIEEEAKKYKYPVVRVGDRKGYIEEIKKLVS